MHEPRQPELLNFLMPFEGNSSLTFSTRQSTHSPPKRERSTSPSYQAFLGSLATLPREIRDLVWQHVVTGTNRTGWGKSSDVKIDILAASRAVSKEALQILYNSNLIVPINAETCSACPPSSVLARMAHLTVEISFMTNNRGDYAYHIQSDGKLNTIVEYIALSLRHTKQLKTLDIVLLNESLRKLGSKPIKSDKVRNTVRGFLRPFSVLPQTIQIRISGFDTLDYLEMFDEMRSNLVGSDIAVEDLCDMDTK